MSTNVKRATRKDLLPDYYSFNISDYIQYYSRIFFKNFFCSFLFSLQHGGQIRSSLYVTSRESGQYVNRLVTTCASLAVTFLARFCLTKVRRGFLRVLRFLFHRESWSQSGLGKTGPQ